MFEKSLKQFNDLAFKLDIIGKSETITPTSIQPIEPQE